MAAVVEASKLSVLCEGADNLLTVGEVGQSATVLQLFLGCWLCESTLNTELMTHCQNFANLAFAHVHVRGMCLGVSLCAN